MKITTIFPTEIMSWPAYQLSREQVAAINAAISAEKTQPDAAPVAPMRDQLQTLRDYLEESHHDDLENDHHGDDPDDCSYCKAIAEAGLLLALSKPDPVREAAPDLLAALEEVERWNSVSGIEAEWSSVMEMIRAAIAKARGV